MFSDLDYYWGSYRIQNVSGEKAFGHRYEWISILVPFSNPVCAALEKFRSSPAAQDVNFTVKYLPYQLYPEASKEGEDKYEWYATESF